MSTKRTVEIEDTLDDIIDNSIQELKDAVLEYINENYKPREARGDSDFDHIYQKLICDRIHEIADSNAPIYTSEINDLYYLYSDDFDEAYKNAGVGNGDEDNYKQVAIYFYIEQKLFDSWNDMEKNNEDIWSLYKELKRKEN